MSFHLIQNPSARLTNAFRLVAIEHWPIQDRRFESMIFALNNYQITFPHMENDPDNLPCKGGLIAAVGQESERRDEYNWTYTLSKGEREKHGIRQVGELFGAMAYVAYSHPWSQKQIKQCRLNPEHLVGFNRMIEVYNIGTRHSGFGYGTALIKCLQKKCEAEKRYIYLVSLEEAVEFYLKMGFQHAGNGMLWTPAFAN